MGIEIAGIGRSLPGMAISNEALISEYAYEKPGGRPLSAEDIYQRTGIRERYIASEVITLSELSYRAAALAIQNAGIDRPRNAGIDQIIVATSTPDEVFPPTASNVAGRLDLGKGVSAYDISDACAGFAKAMVVAGDSTNGKSYSSTLVIGADLLSKVTNYEDYTVGTLFGDGAGAVLLRHSPGAGGLLSVASDSYPDRDMLKCALPSSESLKPSIVMEGSEVFRLVATQLPANFARALGKAGLGFEDVDRWLLHQANARMLLHVAKTIGVNPDKFVLSGVERTGNTSAASIAIAMSLDHERKPFEKGEKIVISGFGSGMNIETLVWEV